MNLSVGQTIVRILLAIAVCLVAGFWALLVLFSDLPPQQSRAAWLLYITGGHLLAGFFVGFLLPLRWRLAVAVAWGAIVVGLFGLLSTGIRSNSVGTPAVGASSAVALTIFALVLVPAVAGSGGYVGSLVGRKWFRNPTNLQADPNAVNAS